MQAPESLTSFGRAKHKIKTLPWVGHKIHRFYKKTKLTKKTLQERVTLRKAFRRLKNCLKRVEYYQPLYGCNIRMFKDQIPARPCVDRADRIYQEIAKMGSGARILDIGCSLGYFSYYFAERNYDIDGIDFSAENIAICKTLQPFNARQINFNTAEFSFEFVEKISAAQYDMAFLFSVLHHITHFKGLHYAQNLVAKLLDKIPILFVELAIKEETAETYWRQSLPEAYFSIFDKCENIQVKKLDYFSTHLSSARRPLYMVTKNSQIFCGENYNIETRRFVSYPGNTHWGRQFYDCGEKFIKRYLIGHPQLEMKSIVLELNNYQRLGENPYFPTLITSNQDHHTLDLVFNKLKGENLLSLLIRNEKLPIFNIFKDVLASVSFLFKNNLYHNDIRAWNIIFDGEKARLIDLGHTEENEIENTNTALLWLIAQLNNFVYYDFGYPLTEKPTFDFVKLQPEFHEVVKKLNAAPDFKTFITSY